MKLRTKLLVPFGVALALMFALAQLVWLPITIQQEQQTFLENQKELLRAMDPDIARSFVNGDLAAVFSSLTYQAEAHKGIWRWIELFNTNGTRIYPLGEAVAHHDANSDILILDYRIAWEGAQIAEIKLAVDWSARRSELLHSAYQLQGMILLVLAGVMALATFWQQRLVVTPIMRLAEASAQLAIGNFDTPLPFISNDEVGNLTRSFDKMRTSLMHAQSNLLDASEQANAANVAKSRFLATMSHEIRTPMNGILGMAQMLLMQNIDEAERQDYARTILNSGQALLTLLNDILDLSKIEADKLELEKVVVDPEQILHETFNLFHETAAHKGLELEVRREGEPQRYLADPHRLRQMLSNLTNNAIKFTTQGKVCIQVNEVARSGNTALIEFSVTDTGIGIAKDKQELLFKPFSQADSSVTRQFGGTGLGLSIVRSLALKMGGDVGVDSSPGNGSRFWFRIRADLVSGDIDRRHASRAGDEMALPGRQLKGNILVVEDNQTNQKVIQALLKKLGINSRIASDGVLAIQTLRQDSDFDLILMDIHMPVMDGYEATRQIRAWETDVQLARRPIIALTADAFEEDRRRCLDAGMDDFLAKPVSLDKLILVLQRWLIDRGTGTIGLADASH